MLGFSFSISGRKGISMGEIKSTLELALERSKKFALSDQEKKELKQKEILLKANSLFHRYRDGHFSLNEVLKEIDKMDQKTSKTVKESLLSQWIDALSLEDDPERLFKGIEALKSQSLDEMKMRFQHLLSKYQEERQQVKEKLSTQLEKALRKKGIYGSAVEPNFEKSDLWGKENETLTQSYREELDRIKQELK